MVKYLIIISIAVLGVFMWSKNETDYSLNNPVENNTSISDPEDQKLEITETEYDFGDPDSITVLVNRENPIPKNHFPALVVPNVNVNQTKSTEEVSVDERVKRYVEDLFTEAKKAGHNPLLASAYRSYELQNFYYTNYVNTYGQEEADKFSAKPGTSEHQTGLAIDISPDDRTCYLEECFAKTELGKWLSLNAHKFGFLLRYPAEKSEITGYQFEPWHFRYLGVELATEIYNNQLTFEEYVQNASGE